MEATQSIIPSTGGEGKLSGTELAHQTTKPPNHCLAVSTAGSGHCTQPDLCCAVLPRLLAAARAGQVRESIMLTVTSTVGVGSRLRGAAPLHKKCFAILLLLQQEQEVGLTAPDPRPQLKRMLPDHCTNNNSINGITGNPRFSNSNSRLKSSVTNRYT